ncbi:pyridoxal phosphate-dependent aminotransferase [Anaerovibrio sp. RM50]|uniref:pyridoxal phosphate-dependent aminotransferase n=1 Tax=Anaerovibrio sp. RM50 TaxID=1200557 RepID=UPI00047FC7AC|nr:pyridoxal phosphate-dependent aminotransferase [Anaerovibrio sp. RM50]
MIPSINNTVESIPEALSIFINQIVYDKVSKGERVYTFSLGEAFFDIPRFSVPDEKFKLGYHYSSSMGQPKLRKKISDLYRKHYGAFVDDNTELLISAGSKVIIYMLLQTVLNDGDEVLVHEPAWLSYKEQIKLCRGVHIPIPYDKTVNEWEDFITDRTKVIIINNPNNPSGYLYSQHDLENLLEMAQKHDLFILSDEAYSDFLLPDDKFISFSSVDKDKEHCLVVNSLSKNMGMSGWRVGYAIAHQNVIEQLKKMNQHLVTCAATVLQDYMADHFDEILSYTIPQAEEMAKKRHMVLKIIDKLGLKYLPGTGTFYLMLDVSDFKGTTEELVYDLLINHNIAVVPGLAYGESTEDFVRFGIGVESIEDIEKCIRVIKDFLSLKKYDNSKIVMQMKQYGIC